MSKRFLSLCAYAFSHFCVDFVCVFILYAGLRRGIDGTAAAVSGFLLYNLLALGIQPLLGYGHDLYPRFPAGVVGCVVVLAGLLLIRLPWVAVIFCAAGNALFHVAGGNAVLRRANGSMTDIGVFTAPGVLGVAFGTLGGTVGTRLYALPLVLIAASAVLLAIFARADKLPVQCSFTADRKRYPFAVFLLLVLGAVFARAFANSIAPNFCENTVTLLLAIGIVSCVGRAAGGLLADRLGARTVGTVSLFLAIPFLCLGIRVPAIMLIGMLLLNVSVPITIAALASRMPKHPAFAFGILELAMLAGVLPPFFHEFSLIGSVLLLLALVFAAACCIALCAASVPHKREENK